MVVLVGVDVLLLITEQVHFLSESEEEVCVHCKEEVQAGKRNNQNKTKTTSNWG